METGKFIFTKTNLTDTCFILDKTDSRYNNFIQEKQESGISQDELWSFYTTIGCFIYPRLIKFKEQTVGYPYELTQKEWDTILDKMIFTFKKISEDSDNNLDKKEQEKFNEGFELFTKYFFNLWY